MRSFKIAAASETPALGKLALQEEEISARIIVKRQRATSQMTPDSTPTDVVRDLVRPPLVQAVQHREPLACLRRASSSSESAPRGFPSTCGDHTEAIEDTIELLVDAGTKQREQTREGRRDGEGRGGGDDGEMHGGQIVEETKKDVKGELRGSGRRRQGVGRVGGGEG